MFTGGSDGIRAVISTGSFSELNQQTQWRRPGLTPRPATDAQLDRLRLPGDRPLPQSWRTWLAFDTAWLRSFGWFASDEDNDDLVFTPRTLRDIVKAQLGSMWAQFFDVPHFEHCFLLPGGSDSRRVLVLSDHPDAAGEHPVFYIDVDDMPEIGASYAGLDMYLGWAAGLLPAPQARYPTYTDTAKLATQQARNAHHVKHMLAGSWAVQFPDKTLKRSRKP